MKPSRSFHLLCFALFCLLALLAFPEIIFGQQSLYWTDLTWIHYPRRLFAAEEWLAGRIPLWDPYQDTGVPLLAESQVGVLYPFSLIFLTPLPYALKLSLFILLHFALAASFTVILARSLNMDWTPSVLAGLSYGFGGFLMSQVSNLNIMTGAVWLPLIVYAAMQVGRQSRYQIAALAGIPLALQILTAQPQMVFYTWVTLIGYGLYHIFSSLNFSSLKENSGVKVSIFRMTFLGNRSLSWPKGIGFQQAHPAYSAHLTPSPQEERNPYTSLRKTTLCFILMLMVGLLLAAPQMLPTLEQQQQSVRNTERGFNFLTNTSWPPSMALNLMMPSAFGNNVLGFRGDPFQEVFIYIGFIPLLLLPLSGWQRHRRGTVFFMLLLGGSLLLALGKHTPLYEYLIQYLPGFALFRIPARWLMVVNLALAMLAGLGLQTVKERGISARIYWSLTAVIITLMVMVTTTYLFQNSLLNLAQTWPIPQQRLLTIMMSRSFTFDSAHENRLLLGWLRPLTVPSILLLTNGIISQLLLTASFKRWLSIRGLTFAIVCLTAADLVIAGGTTINPTRPNRQWHDLSGGGRYIIEHLKVGRAFPLGMGSVEATVSHLGQYFPSVYEIRSASGHGSSLRSVRYETFVDEAHPVFAIRALGVRYLLTLGQLGADAAATFPLVYQDEESFVYENPAPLPRALIVHETVMVADMAEAIAQVKRGMIDPRETVILEAATSSNLLADPLSPLALSLPTTDGQATVTILHETPQQLTLTASLPQPGYLVLLDSYYPGWVATVNDQPTPIYPANVINRAIYLPTGEHDIQFRYQPRSFWLGVGLAGVAIMVILGLTLSNRRLVILEPTQTCRIS